MKVEDKIMPELLTDNNDSIKTYEFIYNYFISNYKLIPKCIRFTYRYNLTTIDLLKEKLINLLSIDTISFHNNKDYRFEENENCVVINNIPTLLINEKFIVCFDSIQYNSYYTIKQRNEKANDVNTDLIRIFYINEEDVPLNELIEILEINEKSLPYVKNNKKINIIKTKQNGLQLMSLELNETTLDINKNYNDDFQNINELIVNKLNEKTKGLILLHGLAGTGKTSYIRYLASIIDRKFIFLPPNMTNSLSSPEFIEFLTEQKDSVLIIEDAENVLKKRTSGSSQEMSNLLNITDGLLSDILNITIICTFNSSLDEIDEALMRKGRLTTRYEFKELEVEKVNALCKHIDIEPMNKKMTLTDVINNEEASFSKEKVKIGFF